MPRLGHKKSRNGCRQCKARHVKCDESKPCSNCARHGVQCTLVTWDPSAPEPAPVKSGSQRKAPNKLPERLRKASDLSNLPASLPIDYVLNPSPASTGATSEGDSPRSQADPFPYLTKFANKADSIQPNYWVRDLELLHHWTTETYIAISTRDDIRYMWKVTAPKQGIIHTFLMHEILAIAALHIAYLQPGQRCAYYALGIHHQDLAIRAVRQMLGNISSENAGAIFATTTLLTLGAWASSGLEAISSTNGIADQPVDDLLDVFALIQGLGGVLSSANEMVVGSAFSAMFRVPEQDTPSHPLFNALLDQIPELMTFFSDPSLLLTDEVRREYLAALDNFKYTVNWTMGPSLDVREIRFLFYWPLRLGPNFINWLRQKDSGALVILMYYAAALMAAEHGYWFLEGWADRIMRVVPNTVGPIWHPAIQWPLQFIKEEQSRAKRSRRTPKEGQERNTRGLDDV